MIAAPPAVIARRRVERLFLRADAVREADAIPFETRNPLQRRAFDRLCAAGVIRAGLGNAWFLDLPMYQEQRDRRLKRIKLAAGIAAGLGALVALAR